MTKYAPLTEHLAADGRDQIELTFTELDAIVGGLPPSARTYDQWWENDQFHVQSRAWQAAGYTAHANRASERVVFENRRTPETAPDYSPYPNWFLAAMQESDEEQWRAKQAAREAAEVDEFTPDDADSDDDERPNGS